MAKMGRPKLMTDDKIDQLEKLCRFKPKLIDCAEILNVNPSTIEKWIKKYHKCTFSEYRDKKMAKTRIKVVSKLLEQVDKGSMAAIIFALKNLCGWSDNPMDYEQTSKKEIILKYNIPPRGKNGQI